MRTYFQPDEQDEFAAAQDLLVRRFTRWAEERDLPADPWVAEAAWEYRHDSTPDGRLALWGPRQIHGFLLDWMPRTLTVLPDEPLPDGPRTLRSLLRYLDETGLADPRGGTPADNETALREAEAGFAAAMADRERWGLAKFWATTAAEQGVDVTSQGEMTRFVERARSGSVPYDEELVRRIAVRCHTHGPAAVERAVPQLPVALPEEAVLRTLAEASPVVRELRGLAEWAGAAKDGRPLTGTGRLRLADARELVAVLETGDTVDPVHGGRTHRTRSSAELPRLDLAFEWAKQARVVRTAKGRLLAVARAAPLLKDPLALWQRAFEALPGMREALLFRRGSWSYASMLCESFEDVLPDVLNTLYSLPEPMPWPRLRDSVHLAYRSRYDFAAADDADAERRQGMWLMHADADLRRVLDVLERFGCVERFQGRAADVYLSVPLDVPPAVDTAGLPPEIASFLEELEEQVEPGAEARARALRDELAAGPVELIRLTDLGTWAVRARLLADGRDAPLIGELRDAPAAGVLAVMAEHYDQDAAGRETEAWIAAHGGRPAAVGHLTDATRAMSYRTRAEAMLDTLAQALGEAEGTRLLRSLRADPVLAPTALGVLLRRDVLGPDDLTEPEQLLMLAESLLQLLETAGPDVLAGSLLSQGRRQARDIVAAALESGHPDRVGLEELRDMTAERLAAHGARPGRLRAHQARRGKGRRASGRKRRR